MLHLLVSWKGDHAQNTPVFHSAPFVSMSFAGRNKPSLSLLGCFAHTRYWHFQCYSCPGSPNTRRAPILAALRSQKNHLGCKSRWGSLSPAVNHHHHHVLRWTASTQLLNASRSGDSTTVLSSLCQLFATLLLKKYPLICSLNLPWQKLRPFPLVLSLVTWLPPGCSLLLGIGRTLGCHQPLKHLLLQPLAIYFHPAWVFCRETLESDRKQQC